MPRNNISKIGSNNILHINVRFTDPKYLQWKLDNNYINDDTYNQIVARDTANKVSRKEMSSTISIRNGKLVNKPNQRLDNSVKKITMPNNVNTPNIFLKNQTFGADKQYEILDNYYSDIYTRGEIHTCFWCTLEFDHLPCVRVYNIQKKKDHNDYATGNKRDLIVDLIAERKAYCSFNCVMAQIRSEVSYSKSVHEKYLYDLYRRVHGKQLDHAIAPSPCKSLMSKYGGVLSEDEYRDIIGENALYMEDHPHIICVGSRFSRVKQYEQAKYPTKI